MERSHTVILISLMKNSVKDIKGFRIVLVLPQPQRGKHKSETVVRRRDLNTGAFDSRI